jgi:hypothetical protein
VVIAVNRSRAACVAWTRVRLALVALVALVGACVPIAPPPLFARHAGAARDDRGTVTISVVVGIGLASVAGGAGFEVRARWQTADDVALGMGFGAAWGDGDPDETVATTRIYGLRVFAAANPFGQDALAITLGSGISSVNTGMRSLSFDAGGVTSATVADTIEPSLGIVAAVAVPFEQGEPFGARDEPKLPTTTFYYGGSLGLAVHLGSTRNVLSAETGLLQARSLGGEHATALYVSAADAQGARP